MSEDAADDAKAERRAWIVWGALIAVAVGVYELFQQPALLGATISLKFAWGDARTGWWLWTRDPDRRRGQAHFWVYLGFGLWKAALAGIVLSFAFVFLDVIVHGPAKNRAVGAKRDDTLMFIFAGSCVSGSLTAMLSGLVTSVGLLLARRSRVKLWLNSRVAAARVRDIWPPDFGEKNRITIIALPSAFTAMLTLFGIFTLLTVIAFDPKNGGKEVVVGGIIVSLVALIIGTLKLLDWTRQHLIAYSPVDAWPDEGEESEPRS